MQQGSERTPDSIKSKIIRIMSSYKEANERLNRTGNGITDPLKYSTFQEYIVNNVCKYYYVLDPVLKDRPNVSPWATNEDMYIAKSSDDEYNPLNSVEFLSSDEEGSKDSSIDYLTKNNIESDSDIEILEKPIMRSSSSHSPILRSGLKGRHDEYSSTMSLSSHNTISTHNTSNISNITEDSNISKTGKKSKKPQATKANSVTPTRKMKPKSKAKYTPSQAKNMEKELRKKSRKSIAHKQHKGNKLLNITAIDDEDREFLIETRDKNINFEKMKHNDMKEIEERKIKIEKERLDMERDTMKLKHEQLLVQNTLERSKLALLRLEIFKARLEIKKANPDVTDDYLNIHCPFPE